VRNSEPAAAAQLVRHSDRITDRTFEVIFLEPEVQTYAFTFG
jgi:hypothetical protein